MYHEIVWVEEGYFYPYYFMVHVKVWVEIPFFNPYYFMVHVKVWVEEGYFYPWVLLNASRNKEVYTYCSTYEVRRLFMAPSVLPRTCCTVNGKRAQQLKDRVGRCVVLCAQLSSAHTVHGKYSSDLLSAYLLLLLLFFQEEIIREEDKSV